jgi:methionyl-tRNA formyltransferase
VLTALADRGAAQLAEVVAGIAAGTARAVPQSGEVTLAPKLSLADGALDWREPAARVLARFRGVTPEPGAHTTVEGARLKVLGASAAGELAVEHDLAPGAVAAVRGGALAGTATEPVLLTRVQPAGKGAMAAADWLRGLRGDAELGS